MWPTLQIKSALIDLSKDWCKRNSAEYNGISLVVQNFSLRETKDLKRQEVKRSQNMVLMEEADNNVR